MKILVLLFMGMTVSVQNKTKGMVQGRKTEGLAKKGQLLAAMRSSPRPYTPPCIVL
jgi:hypothetical protein